MRCSDFGAGALQRLSSAFNRAAKRETAEQLPLSPAERRRLHELNVQQLREAQRSGLPYSFVFDSEDGPIPRPIYQIDGVGY